MNERIIYTGNDGILRVIVPSPKWTGTIEELAAKDVRDAADSWEIVDVSDFPEDRLFRNVWKKKNGGGVEEDITGAKVVAHDLRRKKRDEEMVPWDEIIAKQVPGTDPVGAEAERATLRSKYQGLQTAIGNVNNITALRQLLINMNR